MSIKYFIVYLIDKTVKGYNKEEWSYVEKVGYH